MSNPLVVTLIAVSFPLVVGLIAWIVRELSRVSSLLGRYDERLESLEKWRDRADARADRREEQAAAREARSDA